MLRFKQYLSEAFNIGIIDPDDLPEIVSSNQDKNQLKKIIIITLNMKDLLIEMKPMV